MKKAFTLAEGATHVVQQHDNRKIAFTLAEVLITLGIIGIVAALTMPSLIAEHRKQVYTTGLKKALSTTQNMFNKIIADDGVSQLKDSSLFNYVECVDNGSYICGDSYGNVSGIEEIISKYLNVVKTCKGAECNIVYHVRAEINNNKYQVTNDSYYVTTVNGYEMAGNNQVTGFYTSDGMIYYFAPLGTALNVYIDTNGEKGPNQLGRDFWTMGYCKNNGHFIPSNETCMTCKRMQNIPGIWEDGYWATEDNNYINTPLYRMIHNGYKMDY